jgi:adenosylcobyric acid synthase
VTEFSRHLAVLGTASDVGKSTIVAALCRILRREGRDVAPFKAQNMSNNACVTPDGGEIGRAQYLQAIAAGVPPSVHHNPVLLKPSADNRSQVVVHGRVLGEMDAKSYFGDTSHLKRAVNQSLQLLDSVGTTLVVEGAGSCAEVNLRAREFVNFPVAHSLEASVILLADIDRGGVFAQIVGSLEVMLPEDRARVRGVLINRFRGDRSLFDDGVRYLEERTGLPVLGVVPNLYDLDLDAEDGFGAKHRIDPEWTPLDVAPLIGAGGPGRSVNPVKLRIAVIRLPHIANFTDFDALARVPGVEVHYLARPRAHQERGLHAYAGVILPGSKSTIQDRLWLKQVGWDELLLDYHRVGGHLLGVCGGFQILGKEIEDPEAVEGSERRTVGLGLLDVSTRFASSKTLRQVSGETLIEGCKVAGYEIHLGETSRSSAPPLFRLCALAKGAGTSGGTASVSAGVVQNAGVVQEAETFDGVRDDKRRLWGTYLHGLFDEASFTELYLRVLCPDVVFPRATSARQHLDAELDRLADHVAAHIDLPRIRRWIDGEI